MKLNDLRPNDGAKKVRKRVGHGISAGQGKTAGRGTKGQGARSGEGGRLYRQGGNLPFFRRLPFIRGEGFTPPNQITYNEINLEQLSKLPAKAVVTPELLAEKGFLSHPLNPVVILGVGELKHAITVKAHRFSKTAKSKIEAAGGTAEVIAKQESK
jgi:large subunit ribosomal protein L15